MRLIKRMLLRIDLWHARAMAWQMLHRIDDSAPADDVRQAYALRHLWVRRAARLELQLGGDNG